MFSLALVLEGSFSTPSIHVSLDTIKERNVDLNDSSEELLVIVSKETENVRVKLESLTKHMSN